jgi:hypothetical protein
MAAFVKLATLLFGRLSFCALMGALIGALAGFLFSALMEEHPGYVFSTMELLQITLPLVVICWLVVLLIVGVWLHYGVAAIAWPLLLNAFLTVLLTLWANNLIQMPVLAGLIGLLIGILVGSFLCRFCERLPGVKVTHG